MNVDRMTLECYIDVLVLDGVVEILITVNGGKTMEDKDCTTDGRIENIELCSYLEENLGAVVRDLGYLKGARYIDTNQPLLEGEVVLGPMSRDSKLILLGIAICSFGIQSCTIDDLKKAFQMSLKLSYGMDGTYEVRKGFQVVAVS